MILQKILNPVKSLLLSRRYRNKANPFKAFQELKNNESLPKADKGVIFIGAIRMSATAHLFEGLLAYHYRKSGYKVYAVLCGQKLNNCENKGMKSIDNLKCSICYAEQIEFCKTFDVEPLWIEDFLSKDEEAQIQNAVKNVTIDKIEYQGVDLSSHVKSGSMRVLKTSILKDNNLNLIHKFSAVSFKTFVASRNMLNKYKPKHVILSHGTYATWGSLIAACEVEKIHSVVWGRGYVGTGNIMATHDGSYLFKNSQESIENFIGLDLTDDQIKQTREYFAGKRNLNKQVDYVNYYSNQGDLSAKVDLRKQLNLDPSKKIVGMFPNIPWDGQAFSSSEAFPSIREFIRFSVEWARSKDIYLVIRAHPAENHAHATGQLETFQDILFEIYPKLPENVIFLPANHKIASYQLEEHICVALLYAGTLGLEFTINGTSVIQVGKNANTNKGFIFEPKSKDEMNFLLERALNDDLQLTEEMKMNGLKYGYHWIFRRHFPETTFEFETGTRDFKKFNLKTMDDLLKQKSLNQFIACIEDGTDFIYREELE